MFLYLNILDNVQPDTFSFTCKDGVDVSAVANGGFIALLNILNQKSSWSLKEQNHLNWILNGPALSVRERLVNYQALSRIFSAVAVLNEKFAENPSKILKSLTSLYSTNFLKSVKYTILH